MYDFLDNVKRESKATEHIPQSAKDAVLVSSVSIPDYFPTVKGYDWNDGIDYAKILASYERTGFQATKFGHAIKEINDMLYCRSSPYPAGDYIDLEEDEFIRPKSNLSLFLGYTSNLVTSGLRETIRFLVQHKLVDCLVTTAGGVEEDIIKCLAPSYIGDFHVNDCKLRDNGINRAGNLLIPNENYCLFENWLNPLLDKMVEEQISKRTIWTPSKMITRLGEEIDNEESIYYWAAKNKIPVFCPAITDGSIGDMIYFHSYRNPGLILDIVQDVRRLNNIAIRAKHTGMIILGGGVVKHHICNANLMRNGADYAVYINTGCEYDGSDSGARPEEAKSWGKIRKEATPVKIYSEASLVFPLLVAETFAKFHFSKCNDKHSRLHE